MITEADKSVHLQVGCPAKGPEKGNVLVQVQRQEESQCPSSQALRQKEFSLIQGRVGLFVLFQASADSMRPTHIGKATSFTVYQFRYYAHPETPSQT